MAGEQHLFKVELQNDYGCKIILGGYEKLELLSLLKKCFITQNKMGAWLDDNKVPAEQREQYIPMFRELLHTISFIWDLLKKAGVTETEIREHIEIPF